MGRRINAKGDMCSWYRREKEVVCVTFVTAPAWAQYSLKSLVKGNGYFIARIVPRDVPTNTMCPEYETATAV